MNRNLTQVRRSENRWSIEHMSIILVDCDKFSINLQIKITYVCGNIFL